MAWNLRKNFEKWHQIKLLWINLIPDHSTFNGNHVTTMNELNLIILLIVKSKLSKLNVCKAHVAWRWR